MNGDGVVRAKVGGHVIQIEARSTGDDEVDVRMGDVLSFDSFAESVQAITSKLISALESAKPDRAALEFGLDVGVEAGGLTALLAKGSGSATVKVTLEWESSSKEAEQTA